MRPASTPIRRPASLNHDIGDEFEPGLQRARGLQVPLQAAPRPCAAPCHRHRHARRSKLRAGSRPQEQGRSDAPPACAASASTSPRSDGARDQPQVLAPSRSPSSPPTCTATTLTAGATSPATCRPGPATSLQLGVRFGDRRKHFSRALAPTWRRADGDRQVAERLRRQADQVQDPKALSSEVLPECRIPSSRPTPLSPRYHPGMPTSAPEIAIVAIIALVVFGLAKRLPELGASPWVTAQVSSRRPSRARTTTTIGPRSRTGSRRQSPTTRSPCRRCGEGRHRGADARARASRRTPFLGAPAIPSTHGCA